MKKKLTAIIAAVTLVLAIDASAFNVTISANDANNPWACYAAPGTTLPGGHVWLPWGTNNGVEVDVPTGSYNWTGRWAHFQNAVTFDVDDSGNFQNIQPAWAGSGEGTNRLDIQAPSVSYGFSGAGTGLVCHVHKWPHGACMDGWVGDGDHTSAGMWPGLAEPAALYRHLSAPGGYDHVPYLQFSMNADGKIVDPFPATNGVFTVDGTTGRAEIDTAGTIIPIGSAYVMCDPELTSDAAAIDFDSYRFAELQSKIDNISPPPGPQGPQGKVGSDGAAGGQGPQGKQGDAGSAAPCVDCETLSDATLELACALLLANPPSTVTDFQSSVQAIGAVATVGSSDNICDPIPGGFATCLEYINDQVQGIYDAKAAE